jgi:4-hydroxymandelate synthase
MNILGIDHVEFYVGDARQTAYYLCTAFGFRPVGQGGPETGLTGQRTLLLRHGDIHLLLTSGLVPEHPATEYVARHGDGVAVVAFGVADAAETFTEVVVRGATAIASPRGYGDGTDRVTVALVSGFGDVGHRLVQRSAVDGPFWPERIEPIPAGAVGIAGTTGGAGGALLDSIDHAAICVPAGELAATARFYRDVFGFTEIFAEYIEVGGQGMDSRVVQSPSGGVTFTLIEPDPTRHAGQIDDFLRWHAGAGVQHLAFRTNDIVTAVNTLTERGVGFLRTPASYYDALEARIGPVDLPIGALRESGILVDRDHWGLMYQIFTQSMHVRRTLFLEIIERHGALTFGSNNIKALYEAKQRELSGEPALPDAGAGVPPEPALSGAGLPAEPALT